MKKKGIVYYCKPEYHNMRLDLFLVKEKIASRNAINLLIKEKKIILNEKEITKKSKKIFSNDKIEILSAEEKTTDITTIKKNEHNINILFEHKDFLVINKPPHLLCHPSGKKKEYTIADFAKTYWQDKFDGDEIERIGIVHRLDKETSGILLIAKNKKMAAVFKNLFQNKSIEKKYIAYIEKKDIPREGIITYAITRDPLCPIKMTHCIGQGKEAITKYKILEIKKDYLIVACFPQTGRTHQIRVHMAALGAPIIGDKVYGKKSPLIDRQALHAAEITFTYQEQRFHFFAPLSKDIANLK